MRVAISLFLIVLCACAFGITAGHNNRDTGPQCIFSSKESKSVMPEEYPLARGFTKEEYFKLADAFKSARYVTLINEQCRNHFASGGKKKPSSPLFGFTYSMFVRDNSTKRLCERMGFTAFVPRGTPYIGVCDTFFSLDARLKTLTILHEIWHVLGNEHEPGTAGSSKVDRMLWEACILTDQVSSAGPERAERGGSDDERGHQLYQD